MWGKPIPYSLFWQTQALALNISRFAYPLNLLTLFGNWL